MEVDYNVFTLPNGETKMTHLEIYSLRAKRGKAAEKKILMKDYEMMESMLMNLVILSCGNENSTYNGQYPNGVGAALKTHRENIKTLEDKIKSICH